MPAEPHSQPPRRSKAPSRQARPQPADSPAGQHTAIELIEGFLAELEQRIASQRDAWSRSDQDAMALLARQVSSAARGVHSAPFTAIAAQIDAATLDDEAEIIRLYERLESLTRLCREASVDRSDDA